jgi:hypothetical protein
VVSAHREKGIFAFPLSTAGITLRKWRGVWRDCADIKPVAVALWAARRAFVKGISAALPRGSGYRLESSLVH